MQLSRRERLQRGRGRWLPWVQKRLSLMGPGREVPGVVAAGKVISPERVVENNQNLLDALLAAT
jgi:hypothetical protein